ncbi:hypothetical protein KAI56_04855 [Candidatus Parcubacteria bacterium]|nr:hypothetical protein [Candidatus Parcubacteria bacterium]
MIGSKKERAERNRTIIENMSEEDEGFEKTFRDIFYFFWICPIDLSKAKNKNTK